MNSKLIFPLVIIAIFGIALTYYFQGKPEIAENRQATGKIIEQAIEQATGQVTETEHSVSSSSFNTPNTPAVPAPTSVVKIPGGDQLTEIPNFDPRSLTLTEQYTAQQAQEPLMSAEQSEQVLQEKQQQMMHLISQYNGSLNDQQRKQDIEAKFKLYMEEHKKALLSKIQRGDL